MAICQTKVVHAQAVADKLGIPLYNKELKVVSG